MLPKLHKRYFKEQVVLGSIVNDYCKLGYLTSLHFMMNEIVQFYYYGAQDSKKNKKADDVKEDQREFLFAQCRDCVESVLKSKLYSTKAILTLSKDAMVSGGGVYA